MKVFVLQTGQDYESPSTLKVFNDLKTAKCYALSKGFHRFEQCFFHKSQIIAEKTLKVGFLKLAIFFYKLTTTPY